MLLCLILRKIHSFFPPHRKFLVPRHYAHIIGKSTEPGRKEMSFQQYLWTLRKSFTMYITSDSYTTCGIPVEIIRSIFSFLSNRTTRMRYNGIITDLISITTGIPQGSSLSPILYVLYNSDLLDTPKREK